MFLAYIVCSSSVFTNFATCNVISPVNYVLYFYISTFRSMCVVPNTAAFCISLISWFPGILLRYCLNEFEMVPVDTDIPFAFTSTRDEFVL
jgi:hypothetical protein